MPDETQTIHGNQLSYFAIVPHLADDELDPYEYRLYGHYLRVCGQQNKPCTEKTKTTAANLGISVGKVTEARQALAHKGYITIHEIKRGQTGRTIITLLDIWPRNIAKYSEIAARHHRQSSPGERQSSPGERQSSPGERQSSPGERYKNNQYKNNHWEEQPVLRNDDDASPTLPSLMKRDEPRSFAGDHAHVREATRTTEQLFIEHLAAYIGAQQLWDGWSRYLYTLSPVDLERLKRWLYRFHSSQRKRWRDNIDDPIAFVRSMMDAGHNAGLSEKEKRDLREWEAVYAAA